MRTCGKGVRDGVLILAALGALGALSWRSVAQTPPMAPGAPNLAGHPKAPHFQLTDIAGNRLDLSAYRGKVVLLNFWATWCAPCRWEIPQLIELQERYAADGLSVIGISNDGDVKPVRKFYARHKMNYPVALGSVHISSLYGGIPALPTTFLIGRDGRIYDHQEGARGIRYFESKIRKLLRMGDQQTSPPEEPNSQSGTSVRVMWGDGLPPPFAARH